MGNSNRSGQEGDAAEGAVPARMIGITGINTKYGRRFFINIQSNGQNLKLFGSPKQLADAITAAGFANMAGQIEEGVQLNLSCRAITRPSQDGKYTDIVRVLPAKGNGRW